MWGSYNTCSHIINIYDSIENPPKDKGNLYLSGVYVLEGANIKKNYGIDCVLTIIDRWFYNNYNIEHKLANIQIKKHKWLDLDDDEDENIYPLLQEAHAYIKDQLQHQNVLVHCQMGISRSSSLVIAYMMKQYGMKFKEAQNFVKSKRQVIDPNRRFVSDLMKFEEHLQKNRQKPETQKQK